MQKEFSIWDWLLGRHKAKSKPFPVVLQQETVLKHMCLKNEAYKHKPIESNSPMHIYLKERASEFIVYQHEKWGNSIFLACGVLGCTHRAEFFDSSKSEEKKLELRHPEQKFFSRDEGCPTRKAILLELEKRAEENKRLSAMQVKSDKEKIVRDLLDI